MINDIIEKVDLHFRRAKSALEEIETYGQMSSEWFCDFEKVKTIDSFVYRFMKLQDMMGDKLFRIFLDEIGEYNEGMSLLDVLDRLEKLGVIEDAMAWMTYRKLRNRLTHEYPDNEEEVIEGIVMARDVFGEIEAVFEKIKMYRIARGLADS